MLVLSADSLVINMQSLVPILVGELDRFGLTMLNVQVMSHRYFHADIEEWESTTVITLKTREFAVQAPEVRINDKNVNIFLNGICKYAAANEIVFNLFVRYYSTVHVDVKISDLFSEFIQQTTNLEYKKYFLTF